MSQSHDDVGVASYCTCAKCLALRPYRVLGMSPDLALPYLASQARAQIGDAIYQDIFYEESGEIPADVWESAQGRPYQWWRATNEVRAVAEYALGAFELSCALAGAIGIALCAWAVWELAR